MKHYKICKKPLKRKKNTLENSQKPIEDNQIKKENEKTQFKNSHSIKEKKKSTKRALKKYAELERIVLFLYFRFNKLIHFDTKLLRESSLLTAKKLNISTFKASSNWIVNFKRRNGIKLSNYHSKKVPKRKSQLNFEDFEELSQALGREIDKVIEEDSQGGLNMDLGLFKTEIKQDMNEFGKQMHNGRRTTSDSSLLTKNRKNGFSDVIKEEKTSRIALNQLITGKRRIKKIKKIFKRFQTDLENNCPIILPKFFNFRKVAFLKLEK